MLEIYFESPYTLRRLRSGPLGNHIDGFAQALKDKGYSSQTARRYLRSGAHFGHFMDSINATFSSITKKTLKDFQSHLVDCHCPQSNGGTTSAVMRGAELFLEYLQKNEFYTLSFDEKNINDPEIVKSFRIWLVRHKGVSQSTEYKYCGGAFDLVKALGDDAFQYNARNIREFVLQRSANQGGGATKTLLTSLRAFLRYLISQNLCPIGLDSAIPAIATWRHTTLPMSLQPTDVQRILDACDRETSMGIRDYAIILLFARLGLRAGDVSALKLNHIDWQDGSILVSGKSRRQVRLPLPQEVGEAILNYLEHRQPSQENFVFLRSVAPYRGFRSGSTLSPIVTRAMRRAGVSTPRYGAHILRNTVATEMLNKGVSLYEIGTVLRHKSIDMTNHYTRVNTELLKMVVQPWPEVLL